MRVAFDLEEVIKNKPSGFYSYGAGLLSGMGTLKDCPQFLLFSSKRYHSHAKQFANNFKNTELKETAIKMRWLERAVWQYSSWPDLKNFIGDFDIYHSTHHLMPPTKGKKRVLTVYDLRRYKLPQLYRKSKTGLFEQALKRADHFIAISQATKKDLCEIFGIKEEKVDVIYPATTKKTKVKQDTAGLLDRWDIEQDNFLVVFSSPDSRKNLGRTIRGFLQAKKRLNSEFKLVVVGYLPKNDQDFETIDREEHAGSLIFTGPISDDELDGILCLSCGLVYASLYEGFGFPIVEAFTKQVPLITSDCSSMAEIAADAALLIDPYDEGQIADAMVKIANDDVLRKELIEKGSKRAADFSWEKAACETLSLYQKLI